MGEFFIQKGYSSVSKTFRFPDELLDKLEKLAEENSLSLNNLVVQCLNYSLENLNENDKKLFVKGK